MNHDHSRHDASPPGFWRSRYAIGLLVMYAWPAINEEAEMRRRFGAEFEAYAAGTPGFLPLW